MSMNDILHLKADGESVIDFVEPEHETCGMDDAAISQLSILRHGIYSLYVCCHLALVDNCRGTRKDYES